MSGSSDEDVFKMYDDFTNSFMKEIEESERMKREYEPKVISIHRKKLLIAINEIPEEEISVEENKALEIYKKNSFHLIVSTFSPKSILWNDTKGDANVAEILKEHAKFDIEKYIENVKIICLAYSGKELRKFKAMEYILVHARKFGDAKDMIFKINNIDNDESAITDQKSADLDVVVQENLPDCKFFNKITELIEDLKHNYDEMKYRILNVNATYLTVLMLRRFVKSEVQFLNAFKKMETHDNYVKLCPYPLDKLLPNCNFKSEGQRLLNCVYLAVNAYLYTEDVISKRVLRTTSILHFERTGLQLPNLFFKVTKLYDIKAGDLFDHLISNENLKSQMLDSLFNFANDYYKIYEMIKAGGSNHWFPFCRLFGREYHWNLSANKNARICMVLAYLVDLKIGFDKSTIRNANWMRPVLKENCMKTAKFLHDMLSRRNIPAKFCKVYSKE